MTRREFTAKISELIGEIRKAGDEPVYDYCLRSNEEQNRLYKAGVSGCDGYRIKSSHQRAKAMDIYLVKYNSKGKPYVDFAWTDRDKAIKWHERWEEMGGREMITFTNKEGERIEDRCHFEG